MLSRRRLLLHGAGLATAAAVPFYLSPPSQHPLQIQINRPGMALGHQLRHLNKNTPPVRTLSVNTVIIGSGVAGLTAAWQLSKQGQHAYILLEGPESDGNAASANYYDLSYPTGAHYLALPSAESFHIREMLQDFDLLHLAPDTGAPTIDESALVHAPSERLLINQTWQDELLPYHHTESERFFRLMSSLKTAYGKDGRKVFAVPITLSSQDAQWRSLDQLTFATWLDREAFTAPDLRWYLNYCCKDEYGRGIDQISAWAGLHYFAARGTTSDEFKTDHVLTWPEGLNHLTQKLRQHANLSSQPTQNRPTSYQASVYSLNENEYDVDIRAVTPNNEHIRITAQHVIVAVPLYIAANIVSNISQYGFNPVSDQPVYTPWLIGNFALDQFPSEHQGASLAWDNVIYGSSSLGYVVASHQLIRVAKPEQTIFTTYHALDQTPPEDTRRWLLTADANSLFDLATTDLVTSYGNNIKNMFQFASITARGHAMSTPTPGFLNNQGIRALQQHRSRVIFAHSDLSGYSVFEEAAWWGYQAAQYLLRQ